MDTGFKSHDGTRSDQTQQDHSQIDPSQDGAPLQPHEQASLDQMEAGLRDGNTATEPEQTAPSSHPDQSPQPPSQSAMSPGKAKPIAPQHKSAATPGSGAPGSHASKTSTPGPQKPGGASLAKPANSGGAGSRGKSMLSQLKKRKTQVYLAVSIVVVILAIITSLLAIPFKLLHIVNVLHGHNSQNNEHTSHKAESRLMQALLLDAHTADGGSRSRTGRPLHDFLVNNRISKLDKVLSKKGITMTFDKPGGKLVSIEKGGVTFSNFEDKGLFESRGAIGHLVNENLGTNNVLRRVLYIKAFRAKARVSFKFWAIDKGKSLKAALADKVMKGERSPRYTKGTTGKEPPKVEADGVTETADHKTWAANEAAAQASALGEVGDAARTEAEVFNEKFDKLAARKAAVAKFRASALGRALGWSGYATIYCMIGQIVDEVTDKHYAERTERLIRMGNLIKTQTDEMKAGHVPDLGKWDEYMQGFDGDPSQQPNTSVDGKGFDQSAAWKRNTGDAVQPDSAKPATYTPDLSEAANPNAAVLSGPEQLLKTIFNFPGTDPICKVLTSWFGWVIIGAELGIAIYDGETTTAAGIVASIALIDQATRYILPIFLDKASDLACVGVEIGTERINCSDAGLNLSEKEYGRLLGDRQGSDAENTAITFAAKSDQAQIASAKGWTYRIFSIENNNSLVSLASEKIPSSPRDAIAAISPLLSFFSNVPNTMKILSGIFLHPKTAIAAVPQLDPYGFRSQVTTDQEIDNSDPYAYENFLYQPIPLPGQTIPQSADGSPLTPAQLNGVAYQKPDGTALTRLDMLGDPSTYTPDNNPENGNDPDSQDLMHCFVNKFRDPTDGTHDDICLGLGYLTKVVPAGSNINTITTDVATDNPGSHEIIDKVYCEANDVCGLGWMHTFVKPCAKDIRKACGTYEVSDFDIYRIYLKNVMLSRGLTGLIEAGDPFAANSSAATP